MMGKSLGGDLAHNAAHAVCSLPYHLHQEVKATLLPTTLLPTALTYILFKGSRSPPVYPTPPELVMGPLSRPHGTPCTMILARWGILRLSTSEQPIAATFTC